MKIGVISVTKKGDEIAKKLQSLDIIFKSKSSIKNFNLYSATEELIKKCNAIIFISSTGIAVRAIAPFLINKAVDPAVVVIDCSGKFVISLVSGHLGGANELTLKIADIINAEPIITTATDNLGIVAPDIIAKKNNLVIDDLKIAKHIASRLVEGNRVSFIDERNIIKVPKGYVSDMINVEGIVYVTNKFSIEHKNFDKNIPILKLIRKDIILGIGCKKNFDADIMKKTVLSTLKKYNIDIKAVKAISTIEIKKDEFAITNLSKELNCPINIFTIDEIKKIENKYIGSDFVKKAIGVRAVCEPCVDLSKAKLLTNKLTLKGMTLCIGKVKT